MNNYLYANTTIANNNNAKIYIVYWEYNREQVRIFYWGGQLKINEWINYISVMKKLKQSNMKESDWGGV